MMKIYKKLSLVFLITIVFTSCNSPYKFHLKVAKKTVFNTTLNASLTEKNNQPIDSVQFFVNGKRISSNNNTATINTLTTGLGKQALSALVFYPGKTKKVNSFFEVFANKAPTKYTSKIINSFPHDTGAYTQGLEFYNGFLYETTGRRGKSSLRKVALQTGKVLQKQDLESKYFGEGMTIFNNKIYWLTWESKKGFIYDLKTFTQEGEFAYGASKEGWGLTHNNTELIKTDGTNKIWFLDPSTLKEKRNIQVYTNKYPLNNLNEIEYINGKIYINKWQQEAILIVDPNTGIVESVIDLKNVVKEMKKTHSLKDQDDVLNGIAFDKKNNRLFVTGKHWGKIFEIELIK